MKKCTKCGVQKTLDCFSGATRGGTQSRCRECRNEQARDIARRKASGEFVPLRPGRPRGPAKPRPDREELDFKGLPTDDRPPSIRVIDAAFAMFQRAARRPGDPGNMVAKL